MQLIGCAFCRVVHSTGLSGLQWGDNAVDRARRVCCTLGIWQGFGI